MIKFKKYIMIAFILMFSCRLSNTNNFIALKDAYYKWYKNNNTLSESNYSQNQFSQLDYSVVEEYIFDLKNFSTSGYGALSITSFFDMPVRGRSSSCSRPRICICVVAGFCRP